MTIASPYISPKRFALGGFGIDISGVSAPALRATLQRATTMANTFCNGSQLPQPFDFRGGTVTGEIHQFPIPDPLVAYAGSRRVFVYNRPLRTVTAFAIKFTENYQISLTLPNDLFVNTNEGWCEIVASQPTIIGFPPIGYWYGLYQPQAVLNYTYGTRNAVTGDVCEASSPTTYWASYGQWDMTATIAVQIDGVTVDPDDYTTNGPDGSITFATAPAPGEEVTVAYTTMLPDAVTQGTALIAVDLLAQSRIAARGMIGLQSLKVAEIAITQMHTAGGEYVTQNGIRIPATAAAFLGAFSRGSAA